MSGSCVLGNERLSYINGEEVLANLTDFLLLRKDSVIRARKWLGSLQLRAVRTHSFLYQGWGWVVISREVRKRRGSGQFLCNSEAVIVPLLQAVEPLFLILQVVICWLAFMLILWWTDTSGYTSSHQPLTVANRCDRVSYINQTSPLILFADGLIRLERESNLSPILRKCQASFSPSFVSCLFSFSSMSLPSVCLSVGPFFVYVFFSCNDREMTCSDIPTKSVWHFMTGVSENTRTITKYFIIWAKDSTSLISKHDIGHYP